MIYIYIYLIRNKFVFLQIINLYAILNLDVQSAD